MLHFRENWGFFRWFIVDIFCFLFKKTHSGATFRNQKTVEILARNEQFHVLKTDKYEQITKKQKMLEPGNGTISLYVWQKLVLSCCFFLFFEVDFPCKFKKTFFAKYWKFIGFPCIFIRFPHRKSCHRIEFQLKNQKIVKTHWFLWYFAKLRFFQNKKHSSQKMRDFYKLCKKHWFS